MRKGGARKKWSNRPVMADVARLAGVSASTVSRALRGPAGVVSKDLHARVAAAAEALSYVPNMMAGSLAAASSQAVGIVVPSLNNSVFAVMLEELTNALGAHGYQTMIGNSGYAQEREDALVNSFLAWSPAGIVLTGLSHSRATLRRLIQASVPVIEVGDFGRQGIDSVVGFSHREVGRAVARHYAEQGVERVGVVCVALEEDVRAHERADGFCDGVRDAALRIEEFRLVSRPTPMLGSQAVAALIGRPEPPQAIFFTNDILSLGGLFEAQRRRLRVPEDLRLFGYGDQEFTMAASPSLSSVRPPDRMIGRRAAALLLERFDRSCEPVSIDLGFDLVVRDSG